MATGVLSLTWLSVAPFYLGAAVIPLVFLLGFLYFTFLHLALVQVEGAEGQNHQAEDHSGQDDQDQSGGEGLEQRLHFGHTAGSVEGRGPVQQARGHREPQLLGDPCTHWEGLGKKAHLASLLSVLM